jgi:hypothetical protein
LAGLPVFERTLGIFTVTGPIPVCTARSGWYPLRTTEARPSAVFLLPELQEEGLQFGPRQFAAIAARSCATDPSGGRESRLDRKFDDVTFFHGGASLMAGEYVSQQQTNQMHRQPSNHPNTRFSHSSTLSSEPPHSSGHRKHITCGVGKNAVRTAAARSIPRASIWSPLTGC